MRRTQLQKYLLLFEKAAAREEQSPVQLLIVIGQLRLVGKHARRVLPQNMSGACMHNMLLVHLSVYMKEDTVQSSACPIKGCMKANAFAACFWCAH